MPFHIEISDRVKSWCFTTMSAAIITGAGWVVSTHIQLMNELAECQMIIEKNTQENHAQWRLITQAKDEVTQVKDETAAVSIELLEVRRLIAQAIDETVAVRTELEVLKRIQNGLVIPSITGQDKGSNSEEEQIQIDRRSSN